MKKLNKKKILIIVLIIIVLTFISVIVLKSIQNNKTSIKEDDDINAIEDIVDMSKEYDYEIKSTKDNPLEKNGIEANSIMLHAVGDQMEVTTILKNNTDELINGYNMQIDLTDDNGDTVTTISSNTDIEIGVGKSYEEKNYIMGIKNPEKITGAKIVELEKGTVASSLEETLKNIIPEEAQEQ